MNLVPNSPRSPFYQNDLDVDTQTLPTNGEGVPPYQK